MRRLFPDCCIAVEDKTVQEGIILDGRYDTAFANFVGAMDMAQQLRHGVIIDNEMESLHVPILRST